MITGTTQQAQTVSTPYVAPVHAEGVMLRSLTKKYGSFVAVENINLDIPAGSYCCLLGPSGCGKTTTLRMIAGHEEATSGDVIIGDRRVNDLPPAKRNTAMVFQNYALFPHKTVWQNVEFGLKMRGVKVSDRAQRVNEMLEVVGLSKFGDRKPTMLSGGQQQRVALARALVTRPQVLLLDEPLSALDESLRVKTRSELRKLQRQFGMTFIQVTHAQDEAFSLADQIVVMDHGHIDQIGTPAEIFSAPASRFVARFVGDNNIFVGKVTHVTPDTNAALIQLEVDGLGTFLCHGQAADVGMTAACSVRADRMVLKPHTPDSHASNQISVRVAAVEFTGYVTRVSLLLEATGEEALYKVRTQDWMAQPLQEGELVVLGWSTEDCIFLPH
ncbi:ABC transporter ATP-binding protein [Oculatella sp. FACHB-28]|uniref:ABC transporter ATP-binding protein n=1 Tax=Cyanophyceae TaxID=3028117 RepID=UPI001688E518|nr:MULTISPECIES: ABC transporter ATP-binding protein [Cyanophyceae]MBD2060561.1 ABC transporter ATP-binding protein [Oculatella sp. FACHB-28]MBD2070323.1 ABC transporter ATP-binding protein [Leptolyngbya sp. FACHB-671]